MVGRSTRALDLMPKLQLSPKTTAAALLLVAASVPIGIWLILLTVPEVDLSFARYAFSEENEDRWFIALVTASGGLSLAACIAVALTRSRAVLRSALAACIVQGLALAASGAWLIGAFACAPAWWLYRAQHEVYQLVRADRGRAWAASGRATGIVAGRSTKPLGFTVQRTPARVAKKRAPLSGMAIHRVMRSLFPKRNDHGDAPFEELVPELANFGVTTVGEFERLMKRHRRQLLIIDNSPMDAWHLEYYAREFGVDTRDSERRHYWFAYPALVRTAAELEWGEAAVVWGSSET